MPIRDELTGQWTRRDVRAAGNPSQPAANVDNRTGAAASGPSGSPPVAVDPRASNPGGPPVAVGPRVPNPGGNDVAPVAVGPGVPNPGDVPVAVEPRASNPGLESVGVQSGASAGGRMPHGGVRDIERTDISTIASQSPSPFIIGGFGGQSSDGTESWSKVPRRRHSASPVLSHRVSISNENSFALLTNLEDTSLVTKDDDVDTTTSSSPAAPGVPQTPRKSEDKRRVSYTSRGSDTESEDSPETPTPVDKGKGVERPGEASHSGSGGGHEVPPHTDSESAPEYIRYMGIDEEELDINAQKAALNSLHPVYGLRNGQSSASETSGGSSKEPIEDIIARASKSANDFRDGKNREVREAKRERDTANQARVEAERVRREAERSKEEAERARAEAERARLDAERRLEDLTRRMSQAHIPLRTAWTK
ncbi:hypothetical protein PUNSTDRAFT_138452 [Punctularia strigosozonata HHB-11173 SS5]|uniref:Uncharacterized protein n=1 Tax=Punctularia strigosozonata (strain HHB-11173) TaxID=741275 RepID=R7S1X3_PUNST|nr:uncharacterized protein PUNSTDRAFT_138452 [Punctularia strigosozonata HHB-11173 SS5]EIN04410.1 hypothetical protein PUNSTDRAFT_138452 [Punctularia strigosozonata HHB-11173 SS5]